MQSINYRTLSTIPDKLVKVDLNLGAIKGSFIMELNLITVSLAIIS